MYILSLSLSFGKMPKVVLQCKMFRSLSLPRRCSFVHSQATTKRRADSWLRQSLPEPQFPTWKERHWFDLSCPRYRCTSRLWSAFRLGRLTRLINLGGPSFGADQALLVAGWMPSCLGGGLQAAGIRRPRGDRSGGATGMPAMPCLTGKSTI